MRKRKSNKDDFENKIKKKLLNEEVVSVTKKEKKIKSQVLDEDEEEQLSKEYRTTQKRFPKSDVDHTVFVSIPDDKRISKDTDIGSRVIVAKYPFFYKIYFIAFHEKGEKYFPNGGIKCYNETFEQVQCFPYDSVALHPTKKDKYRTKLINNE